MKPIVFIKQCLIKTSMMNKNSDTIFMNSSNKNPSSLKIPRIGRNTLKQRRNFDQISKVLMCIVAFFLLINICNASMLLESKSFLSFIDAIDPEIELNFDTKNGLATNICLHKLKGVTCNLGATTITEIWLDNRNLSGVIDANSLCNLPNLRVFNLAKNRIHGKIPGSISRCTNLMYMNLSSNLLTGSVPVIDLVRLQNLKILDISRNRLRYDKVSKKIVAKLATKVAVEAVSPSSQGGSKDENTLQTVLTWMPLVLVIGLFFLLVNFVNKRTIESAKEREILKHLAEFPTPNKFPLANDLEEGKQLDENNAELLFFVDGKQMFKMGDLLEAEADLQGQGLCSSLYKVRLKTSVIYAVKRLKQSPVSFDEFSRIMRKIGDMKHQNILPLVGYGSTGSDTKLLIYNFQKNGSLLSLLEKYIEGKRDFPWKSRISIAVGIARGLEFIHGRSGNHDILPHGDIKLSNIMLDENDEPLISEYGYSRFLDPKKACLINSSGYTPPEKSLSEQGDVYSFGVILLELLTGKIVERSGLDLPKWVGAMVREEWTGEVLDKEIAKNGKYAFPLLNISLQCVAQSPEKRPSVAEVLEQIEEIPNMQDDFSPLSSIASVESTPKSLMHSVVPEEWDTPGSSITENLHPHLH